jgi:hypothetical protein
MLTSSAAVRLIELNRAVSLKAVNAKQSRSGAHGPTGDSRISEPVTRFREVTIRSG